MKKIFRKLMLSTGVFFYLYNQPIHPCLKV